MSVSRNAGYNFAGAVVPVIVAFVTVPIYLKLVGPDRYGVLSIAWLLLGYFGLFDLGLGRATSFRIAALRDAPPAQRARTFWAALIVNTGMGLVGAAVLWAAAAWFFAYVFKVQASLRPEIMRSVPLLAASVPVATVAGVLTGALQGRERFLETNAVSTLSTGLFQILPLAVAWRYGPDLVLLLSAALAARLLALVVLGYSCYAEFCRGHKPELETAEVVTLLKYGGWVTVTSIFGPFLVISDRFFIGGVLGAVAVAVYSIPYQLAKQVALIPSSLTNALFPRLAAASPGEQNAMGEQATRILASMMTLPVLGAVFLVDAFLHLWIGHRIGAQSAPVARVLLIGFWANGFALVPFTRLQAGGRPDLVTKVLLAEIPLYLLGLYLAMTAFGLVGAAAVLALRFIVDYALLTFVSGRNFSAWPTLTANFALLLAGDWLAGQWSIDDWRWWASAVVTVAAVSAVAWLGLPAPLRGQIGQRIAGRLSPRRS